LQATLLEEGSEVHFKGLDNLSGNLEAHTHILIEHKAPHCISRQHFKKALREQSLSSFEGKIYVHPEAQKTEAYQLNQNLILSDGAKANAKPNLEIFADDVKASHGATFSQMNEEEIFYFRARGLSLKEAKSLLFEGFCRELVDGIEAGPMKDALKARLAR
jgi:Fe-S cluster assembly protein SufD